jgi:hypothetical protein
MMYEYDGNKKLRVGPEAFGRVIFAAVLLRQLLTM